MERDHFHNQLHSLFAQLIAENQHLVLISSLETFTLGPGAEEVRGEPLACGNRMRRSHQLLAMDIQWEHKDGYTSSTVSTFRTFDRVQPFTLENSRCGGQLAFAFGDRHGRRTVATPRVRRLRNSRGNRSLHR